MKSSFTLALALGLLFGGAGLSTTGCAKKKAPESVEPGSNFTVGLSKAELLRRETTTVREFDQIRYTLDLNNGLTGGAVKVDKIEFSYGIGERDIGTETVTPAVSVDAGGKASTTVIGRFEWRETSTMPEGDAWIKGTVYWTGPNAARTTPFDLSTAYTAVE